jgi:hypothetical protein
MSRSKTKIRTMRSDDDQSLNTHLEADEIGAEHAIEDLCSAGETAEDFAAGERRVDKEPYMRVWGMCADHAGNKEEVVIVDPDKISRLELCEKCVGISLVRLLVRSEGLVLNGNFCGDVLPEQVVEQRPESYTDRKTASQKLSSEPTSHSLVLQYPS